MKKFTLTWTFFTYPLTIFASIYIFVQYIKHYIIKESRLFALCLMQQQIFKPVNPSSPKPLISHSVIRTYFSRSQLLTLRQNELNPGFTSVLPSSQYYKSFSFDD